VGGPVGRTNQLRSLPGRRSCRRMRALRSPHATARARDRYSLFIVSKAMSSAVTTLEAPVGRLICFRGAVGVDLSARR
jgi:hypothetical protein